MAIIIRTSDRGYFKRCRQLWDFTSKIRGNWEPLQRYLAFDFGTAMHAGWEAYYDPETWGDLPTMRRNAREAFRLSYASISEKVKVGDLEFELNFNEAIDLGMRMLDYYFTWAPKVDNFTPLYREIEFEVPIPGLEGLAVYQGRIDLIVEDEYGYWLVDHKAQPLDELVLTPKGFTCMGNIHVGDFVIGSNGKPTAVVGVYPQGVIDCYKVTFNDGTVVRCSADHLWTVAGSKGSIFYRGDRTIPTSQIQRTVDTVGWATPQVAPVAFDDKDLPIHPYLLGLYLAEGHSGKSNVTLTSKTGEAIRLAEELTPMRFRKCSELNFNWTPTSPEDKKLFRDALRAMDLWELLSRDKFIPNEYLRGSVEQRMLLLQGLMDGDGMVDRGRPRFCTLSRQLVRGVKDLVQSLGGTARVSWGDDVTPHAANGHKVNISLPKSVGNPFRLEYKQKAYKPNTRLPRRAIVSIEPDGQTEMQCIQVEAADGLYVTRGYVLTHNTAAQFSSTQWLALDDQCSSYAWAIRKQLGLEVRGVIYNQARKKPPDLPNVLKNGTFSKNKQQDTTFELYLRAIREAGQEPHWYRDFLLFLKQNPKEFCRRTQVSYSPRTLDIVEQRIQKEAWDMIHDPLIYPSPSPMNCNGCRFFAPCLALMEGADPEPILEENYMRRA